MFRKHHLHLHVIFIHEKNIVYTYLFLIMLITLITSGNLNDAFVLNANDMPIKVMFIWTFWYLICIFLSLYELVMNFQSFGQTVKGYSRDHDGKSKGKTEQARKVRAKPVGRNQLGVKMQLTPFPTRVHSRCCGGFENGLLTSHLTPLLPRPNNT